MVLLLQPRTIPKTTSGKIARQWVKTGYLKGTLTVIDEYSNLSTITNSGRSSCGSAARTDKGTVVTVSQADLDSKKAIDPTLVSLDITLSILIAVVADVLQTDAKLLTAVCP